MPNTLVERPPLMTTIDPSSDALTREPLPVPASGESPEPPRELNHDGPLAGLIDWLRGRDNPFDDYVQTRRGGGSFRRGHTPEVNKEICDRLLAAIERYRIDRLETQAVEEDLPRSGVVVAQGKRGAGKTHLLLALRASGAAVLVAPAYYEPERSMAEYLLQQLVWVLQEESAADAPGLAGSLAGPAAGALPGKPVGALAELAEWFARQVLVQALLGMPETEWLAHNAKRRYAFLQGLKGWGARSLLDERDVLIHKLQSPNGATLGDIGRYRGPRLEALRRIALRHVVTSELGQSISAQIRRGLYLHLVELAFGYRPEAIFEYLLDGFTHVEAPVAPSRETLVEELLRALIELYALFGRPVVFAFDVLETLLGDPPDERRCHGFFHGLAELIDSHHGIPVVIFAEYGHWQQANSFLSSYAAQRLQQGIPTRGYGSLATLVMPDVSVAQVKQLIARRMRDLLRGFEGYHGGVPDHARLYPFAEHDLVAAVRVGETPPPLRQCIQALRDRYNAIVFGQPAKPELAPALSRPAAAPQVDMAEVLESKWHGEVRTAQRRIEAPGLSAAAGRLTAGAEKWLRRLIEAGAKLGDWKPIAVENKLFGEHPTYGQLLLCDWRRGDQTQRVGLGFLLAAGRGMRADLRAKLEIAASPSRPVDFLVILWPREPDNLHPAHELLPRVTQETWDDYAKHSLADRVRLEAVRPKDFAPWLALESWETQVREQEGEFPTEAVSRFLLEHTAELLNRVSPG